jgi:putative lysine transport system permease protein
MPSTFLEWIVFLWREYSPLLLKGAWTSLYLAFLGTGIGFLVGLLVAIIRTIPDPPRTKAVSFWLLRAVKLVCAAYIEVFRGTPLMVQAMVIYYGLLRFASVKLPLIVASMLIVGINTGAYMAEIIRSGIISVDRGQTEAAMSLGMSHWQTMQAVILPQAIRNALPSVGNELVVNVKDTSVLNVIAVSELFFVAKSASGTYLKYFEVYTIVAVMYLIMTMFLSRLLARLEKRMDGPSEFEAFDPEKEGKNG